jgi:membrane protein implicated in regulation of membrane protease activity
MSTAWLWAIGGLILVGGEALLPGVFLLWIGIAALLVAIIGAVLPISLEVQLALFAIAAVLSCVVGWLVARSRPPSTAHGVNDPRARVVGSIGHVTEAIRDGQGKVRIGDSDWLAEGPDLAPGAAVRVTGLAGNTVRVKAL